MWRREKSRAPVGNLTSIPRLPDHSPLLYRLGCPGSNPMCKGDNTHNAVTGHSSWKSFAPCSPFTQLREPVFWTHWRKDFNTWMQSKLRWSSQLCHARISHGNEQKLSMLDFNCLAFFNSWGDSPLGTSATSRPTAAPDNRRCVGGMRTGRGNRNTRIKPVPMLLRPQQIPHDLKWGRTRAAVVGGLWLTAWGTAGPLLGLLYDSEDRGATQMRFSIVV
jgi:hypothetical protein